MKLCGVLSCDPSVYLICVTPVVAHVRKKKIVAFALELEFAFVVTCVVAVGSSVAVVMYVTVVAVDVAAVVCYRCCCC